LWFSVYFGRATLDDLVQWMRDITQSAERQGVVWDESGATVWICVKDEKAIGDLRREPIMALEDRGPVVVRQRREGPATMEPLRYREREPAVWELADENEKTREGTKFSDVTKKMVEQLRKTKGFKEQETDDGPSQGRHQPNELPEDQKDMEREPLRTTRPQGKGRSDRQHRRRQQKEHTVRTSRQQRRKSTFGPPTAHESARQEGGSQDFTRAQHEHEGDEK